jgi:ADP-L-glycero-D-manno-heptose 6-epimerase
MMLVTGGAGFIGSHVVAALEERGRGPIAVCDTMDEGKWRNLAKRRLAEVIPPEALLDWLGPRRDIEAIVHMGAISSTTATDEAETMRVNYELPVALWDWCAGQGVRLVYASSAATYGDGTQGFDDEFGQNALARLQPLNLYGRSKHAFDREVARRIATGAKAPPHWAGLKFFNVYGPNEYHKAGQTSVVLQNWREAKASGRAILFRSHNPNYADGGQSRDFIWVGDCADVVLWLLDATGANGLYNVGTGKARSFKDLATAVFAALGRAPNIEYVDTPIAIRDKYQYFTEARMERLRAAGYAKPFTGLEDGVARYVRGYLETVDPYR